MLRRLLALAGLGALIAALWWRKNPSACPYGQRFWVEAPHPGITRKRLIGILEPRAGERVLEIGPGTGYYTFEMAERLDGGQVDVFDIQQEMLDHVMREANRRGATNVSPALGDAQSLPYADDSFDAVVLITVLGEIPDQDRALREIARVLRPGGRLVVGELFGDPHMVTSGKLRERAGRSGLAFVRRVGSPLAFFARLE
ncbi:MAG: class I SAM-dependent methyltransferase, partial [Solirubrobacterales bacterium]